MTLRPMSVWVGRSRAGDRNRILSTSIQGLLILTCWYVGLAMVFGGLEDSGVAGASK